MNKGIILPAIVESLRTRKDRTIAITIGTQEMEPAKAGEIFSLNNQLVTVYISPTGIDQDTIDIIDTLEPELPGKSPSQRLRSILYLLWKQDDGGFKDKNLHYLHHMEKIIDHYKSKLDE